MIGTKILNSLYKDSPMPAKMKNQDTGGEIIKLGTHKHMASKEERPFMLVHKCTSFSQCGRHCTLANSTLDTNLLPCLIPVEARDLTSPAFPVA